MLRLANRGKARKKSSFSEQQIAFNLKQPDDGTSVEEGCRKAGISHRPSGRWTTLGLNARLIGESTTRNGHTAPSGIRTRWSSLSPSGNPATL